MNTLTKICIGVITGVGAIWSLGGFESENDDNRGRNHNHQTNKKKVANNHNHYEENSRDQRYDNRFQGELLSDDGPDATDREDPCAPMNGVRTAEDKHRATEAKFVSNVRTIQDTFTKIRNVFDFIISIGANFLRLFGNSSPQQRVQPSIIIY